MSFEECHYLSTTMINKASKERQPSGFIASLTQFVEKCLQHYIPVVLARTVVVQATTGTARQEVPTSSVANTLEVASDLAVEEASDLAVEEAPVLAEEEEASTSEESSG